MARGKRRLEALQAANGVETAGKGMVRCRRGGGRRAEEQWRVDSTADKNDQRATRIREYLHGGLIAVRQLILRYWDSAAMGLSP